MTNRALILLIVPLFALVAGCDRGDRDAAERERAEAAEAGGAPAVAPVAPDESGALLPEAELGSLRAENVMRVLPWTSERLDRGGRPAVEPRTADPAAPAAPDPDVQPAPAGAVLADVLIEEAAGFDRVVFQFEHEGELPPYHLSYVDAPPIECGSGRQITPGGEGWLFVQLLGARAHDETGESTISREVRAPGLPTLKELRLTCDSEATVEWVVAFPEARPYRVIEARNPARLVVDVQH